MSRICYSPRNVFKFHSRLIAIFFCSLFSILFVILVNAIMIGPLITFVTETAVYYWQVYAPMIGAIEGLLNLNNATANHFDADYIKEIVTVFQERISKPPDHFTTNGGMSIKSNQRCMLMRYQYVFMLV